MKYPRRVALALALTLPTALGGQIQSPDLHLPPGADLCKKAVVDIFKTSYDGYKKFAFGHDTLKPVSKSFSDERNGWGASIIDAMSTMQIMGLNDLFKEAVDFAVQIDFSKSNTPDTVSVFETTIRYLGGLLSAYELSGEKNSTLLRKAQEVADKLAFAWVGDNDIPYGFIDFSKNQPQIRGSNIAEAGTLILEWATLSKHTGNPKYANLALKALRHIAKNPAPLPGLAAQGIDPSNGNAVGGYVTWGGGSDSYFEYLIKYTRLFNPDDNLYPDTWYTAVDSSIRTLLKKSTVGEHVYLADYDDQQKIRHVGSHLACFHGGNWIMGGKMMNNQTIVDIGLQLVDACWNTYAKTATGIGPEVFAFVSDDGDFTGGDPLTPEQHAFYEQNGFYIIYSDYIQRPEVLESNFYAWRATGDPKYIDRAATAVRNFQQYLKVQNGFSGIDDVNNRNTTLIDSTESFWFAETLKYLYLTFDNPDRISLDKYVFNTECHPLKAPPPKPQYGTKTIIHQGAFTPQAGPPLPTVSPTVLNLPLLTPPNLLGLISQSPRDLHSHKRRRSF